MMEAQGKLYCYKSFSYLMCTERFHDPDLAFGRYHYDYNPCFGFSIGSGGDCNNGNTAVSIAGLF